MDPTARPSVRLSAETRTEAMDYGFFTLRGGPSSHDLDPMPLLDAADGHDVASDGRTVLVLSPHQNNFELEVTLEVWDAEPPEDPDAWEQVVRAPLEVTDARLDFEAPTLPGSRYDVASGRYVLEVSGRGFVTRGWPGSTTPGDVWRVRLWPAAAGGSPDAVSLKSWTAPPPPAPEPAVAPALLSAAAAEAHWLSSLDPAVRALLPTYTMPTMADVHAAMAIVFDWDDEQIERSRRIREGLPEA